MYQCDLFALASIATEYTVNMRTAMLQSFCSHSAVGTFTWVWVSR